MKRLSNSPHRAARAVLIASTSLLVGCATGSGADRQLQSLEAENAKLRAQYAEAQTAAKAGYDSATQAETRAGIANQPCTVVSPVAGEPQPRPGAVLAKVRLSSGVSTLSTRPSGGRTHGPVRIAPASCDVGRR